MTARRENWEQIARNYEQMKMAPVADAIRAQLAATKRVNVTIDLSLSALLKGAAARE